MSTDRPTDSDLAAALGEALTLWATPGLVENTDRPDLGPLAVLALVPNVVVQTRDTYPGAELVDIVISWMLRSGFRLLPRIEPAALVALPLLETWSAELSPTGRQLRIVEPAGALYDGDLGPQPLAGWHEALREHGRLIVLLGSGVDIGTDSGVEDRDDRLDAAAGAGGLVGAQVPLERHGPR